jgi:hypothetical protein
MSVLVCIKLRVNEVVHGLLIDQWFIPHQLNGGPLCMWTPDLPLVLILTALDGSLKMDDRSWQEVRRTHKLRKAHARAHYMHNKQAYWGFSYYYRGVEGENLL